MCGVVLLIGCPRVVGDDEESDDGDDFDEEFQTKDHQETRDHNRVDKSSVI